MIYLLIFCAGGVGAVLRFVLDTWFKAKFSPRVPLGIFLINSTGSLALGLLTGLLVHTQGPHNSVITENIALVLGGGFLGGYTTFSTALLEAVTHPGASGKLVLVFAQSFFAVLLAAVGLVAGAMFAV